ncbi:HEAT repeat domain-containing protein [Lihuaxuella thermophila]|uniref:HEAT repeat-containing protein n=1 Tax=Lihuaxuella thermophila TaxID=1173111 RepID=A0A1H8ID15_9BACL|nr:HEAT repeat domain-containing protein [Lihuaxuella thermophila]SEN66082.1 hypothetical protein SAMN05444955_11720 [Lihuaxuella thermophila]
MEKYNTFIQRLIDNDSDGNEAKETIRALSPYRKEIIPLIIENYNKAGPSGKCGLIEALIYISDPSAIPFLEKIVEDDREIFFVKAYAEGALEKLESNKKRLVRIIKRLPKQRGIDLRLDIATLGAYGDSSVLSVLDQVQTTNKKVREQIEVAKLQIHSGIQAVIDEYKKEKPEYSEDVLAEAIYNSPPGKYLEQIIVQDLFSSKFLRLHAAINHVDLLSHVDEKIIERLFEILEGNFPFLCRMGASLKRLEKY